MLVRDNSLGFVPAVFVNLKTFGNSQYMNYCTYLERWKVLESLHFWIQPLHHCPLLLHPELDADQTFCFKDAATRFRVGKHLHLSGVD